MRFALAFFGPAALATVAVGVLVPRFTHEGASRAVRWWIEVGHQHVFLVWGGFFVLFSLLWRAWLSPPVSDQAFPLAESARHPRSALSLIGTVLAAASAALLFRAAGVESFQVLSASMVPTLDAADVVWVSKSAYGVRIPGTDKHIGSGTPRRGDVVVFRAPKGETGPSELVKRVIGLPGDEISMVDGHPLINGWQIPSCDAGLFVHLTTDRFTRGRLTVEFLEDQAWLTVQEPGAREFRGTVVKPGEVFVLGDNRGVSNDSRSWNHGEGGGVPVATIIGRAQGILSGTDRTGRVAWNRVLASLRAHHLHLPGLDTSALEAGINKCLQNRPASTTPGAGPSPAPPRKVL